MDFEFRDLAYIGTVIFAAGIIYAKVNGVQTTVDKIQVTLFGMDGRNGLVGDVRSAKEHTDECKAQKWHTTHASTGRPMSQQEELAACKLETAAEKALDRIEAAAHKAADKLERVAHERTAHE